MATLFIVTVGATVVGNVISYFVCKWLDKSGNVRQFTLKDILAKKQYQKLDRSHFWPDGMDLHSILPDV